MLSETALERTVKKTTTYMMAPMMAMRPMTRETMFRILATCALARPSAT